MNKKLKNTNTMKKALIDQVLLWIVVFITFSGFFLFVVDYTNILKIKKNMNHLAEYGARMKGSGVDDDIIATGINDMIIANMNTVTSSSIACTDDSGAGGKREVIFKVTMPYTNKFFTGLTNIDAISASFNDQDSVIRTCTLTLTAK